MGFMSDSAKAILITGCPRSGTTWLGRIISAPEDVRYVHEPFNPNSPHPASTFRTSVFFERIASKDISRLDPLAGIFSGGNHLPPSSFRKVRISTWLKWAASELGRRTVSLSVVKDPLAFLSVEAIAARFQPKVVVIFRRPEAVVSSFISRQWNFKLSEFISRVRPFGIWTDEQLAFAENADDTPFERVAHMWRLLAIYGIRLREEHPDWHFVRYEDLVGNAEEELNRLCVDLGLEFKGERRDFMREMNRPSDRSRGSESVHDVRRSRSHASVENSRLDALDMRRISDICGAEMGQLYPETV